MRASDRLALYTVVYPGVEPYLAPWYASVRAQTDAAFDLWISLDGLSPAEVRRAAGAELQACWLPAAPGDSPARLRTAALRELAEDYPAVVLVDADDVMHESRVAAARAGLRRFDVIACALRLIDGTGRDLALVFGGDETADAAARLARCNVFGLSNTAYRGAVLRHALPLPDDCVLVDWLLATRAWLAGAALGFDATPRMSYRQHAANTARVLPPFDAGDVLLATERVLAHYRLVLDDGRAQPVERRRELEAARDRVRRFHAAVSASSERLERYLSALHRLPPRYVWWWAVAHPELEETWSN